MKATGKRKAEGLTTKKTSRKTETIRQKDVKTSDQKRPIESSDYFSDLKDRLEKATSKQDKLKIYNTVSPKDRVRLAEYDLLKAGGSRITHRAPLGMFPPTIAGFEARTEYEDEINR